MLYVCLVLSFGCEASKLNCVSHFEEISDVCWGSTCVFIDSRDERLTIYLLPETTFLWCVDGRSVIASIFFPGKAIRCRLCRRRFESHSLLIFFLSLALIWHCTIYLL